MKRVWLFIGAILVTGVVLFEEQHRAETAHKHVSPDALMNAPVPTKLAAADPIPLSNFSDQVDLWGDPWVRTPPGNLTGPGLDSQDSLKPANLDKFRTRLEYKADPMVTVVDRQAAVSLLQLGGFKLNLNLKPEYPNPEAILPSRIDPGFSASFDF